MSSSIHNSSLVSKTYIYKDYYCICNALPCELTYSREQNSITTIPSYKAIDTNSIYNLLFTSSILQIPSFDLEHV